MQLQLQQLQQQLSQQWREDQSSLQQQLDNISRTAVSDAIKQLVTDQVRGPYPQWWHRSAGAVVCLQKAVDASNSIVS